VAERTDGLVERVTAVSEEAGGLVRTTTTVCDRAGNLISQVEQVTADATGVIGSARQVADRANDVVTEAQGASRQAGELLDLYGPLAREAAPLARKFVDELSEDEIHAAIKLVDHLPVFTEHMENDIMPILATLDRVGPDVHELLDVLKEVRQAIVGIPGFRLLSRRGSDRTDD